jgi:hypothetical protein
MEESWKDILGYEGLYQVSTHGEVKSLSRFNSRTERILTPVISKGYPVITLSKNNIHKIYSIHRLVAECFIPNPENKPEVNHINGIKTDCLCSNLEWCTSSENQLHAFRTGLQKPYKHWIGKFGASHNRSKKVSQMTKEGVLIGTFENARHAEQLTGINHSGISDVCRGTSKTAGGFRWRYS